MGTLFSAWQATTHAWQPVQASRSIAMPQRFCGYLRSGYIEGRFACSGALPSRSSLTASASATVSKISREWSISVTPAGEASFSRVPVFWSLTRTPSHRGPPEPAAGSAGSSA